MDKKIIIVIPLVAILTITLAYIIIKRPTSPSVYVNPQTIRGTSGQDFTINIGISNVADLYGWGFKLRWNTTILEVVNVTEGNFLKQGGETLQARWRINNTQGYIVADCTLLGNVSGVSGDGILATINLHVKGEGECILDLYDTVLISSLEQPIDHDTEDGYFST